MGDIVFPRMEKPKGWLLVPLFITAWGIPLMFCFTEGTPADIAMMVTLGTVLLFVDAWFAWWIVPKVTVNGNGITLSAGRFVLQQLRADEIRTVVKIPVRGRFTWYKIRILTTPAEAIEARGEARLCTKPIVREGLKFRRNKSDFKDICLKAGLPLTGGFWIEFTPQRQQQLRQMFPEAAYREAKSYTEPPSLT